MIKLLLAFTFSLHTFQVADDRCEERKTEIVEILRTEGVRDADFFYYLPLAESRCKDSAESRAGARSMWQMMPWLIRRRDVTDWRLMTKIAAQYIASIQKRLIDIPPSDKNWFTVAAWNTGLTNMRRVCQPLTKQCVRKQLPAAAALANTVTDYYAFDQENSRTGI